MEILTLDSEISDDSYLSSYLCLLIFLCFYNINIYLLYNARKDFASKLMIFPAFVGEEPLAVFEKQCAIVRCGRYRAWLACSMSFPVPSRPSSCPAVFGKLKMILLDSFAARVSEEIWVVPVRPLTPSWNLKGGQDVQCVTAIHSRSCVVLQPPGLSLLPLQLLAARWQRPDHNGGLVIPGPKVVHGNSTYNLLLQLFQ